MTVLSRRFGRSLLAWNALGVMLSCSACATVSTTARTNPAENGPVQAIYKETAKPVARRKSSRPNRDSEIQQLNATQPANSANGVYRDSAIQQMAYTDESAAAATPAGWHPRSAPPQQWCPPQLPPNSNMTIQTCPPDARWAAAGPNPLAPGMMACDVCNTPSTEKFDDEYLCDGGDRDIPIHYDAYDRLSLDTEDTVLEYTDRDGNEHVKPSNKVCVYAPRFSSVRTVSRPHEEASTNEVAGIGHLATTGAMHSRLRASKTVTKEATGGIAVRSRASSVDSDSGQKTVHQLRGPSTHDKLLNIYQATSFVRLGLVDDADTARLNYGLQAASAWTREEYPVITAKTDMVLEGKFTQWAAVITGIEDEVKKAEELRIVKLADKKSALPGDEIEFTIRYDNLGGKEAHHIRIVDNLTPRLQYIDDSATSDRAGRLVLQDNGEGSQILIWELEEPLPGKTGGTVTFKARVR